MKKALVIEDNEDNMKLITFILEKNSFHPVRAETGRKGIALACRQSPDFILLDVQLPDMDGQTVLRTLRGPEINCLIPVIAVTSFAMTGDKEKLLAAGCTGYIENPIDPEKVITQIKEIIGEEQ